MKKKSYFINTAKSPIDDYEVFLKYFKSRHLGVASLDKFEIEPLLQNHPLGFKDNLILTPHVARALIKTDYYVAQATAKDLKNYSQNKDLINNIC